MLSRLASIAKLTRPLISRSHISIRTQHTMATALANVPAHLTIKVLYSDSDVVVIDKPCDLRSVPGHATERSEEIDESENNVDGNVKPQRLTAQEAWVHAIRSFRDETDSNVTQKTSDDEQSKAANELISNLSVTSDANSIPRKCPTFERYCQRNRRRLLPSFPQLDTFSREENTAIREPPAKRRKKSHDIPARLKGVAQIAFSLIQQRQRPLMNLPTPTDDKDSAIGQLRLLGYGEYAHNNHNPPETVDDVKKRISDESKGDADAKRFKLHVVHRLDCQTSGIMVVARNADAASILCQQWRERESIKKTYLAFVKRWPPYHEQKELKGKIDLPLAASRTERIKWEVRPAEDGGKPSLTLWKIHESSLGIKDDEFGLTLELQPMTGRTHQLRIHCAAIGSGIDGDSLYGDNPIEWTADKSKHERNVDRSEQQRSKTLHLHAHRLTFPHPRTGKDITFESPKPW